MYTRTKESCSSQCRGDYCDKARYYYFLRVVVWSVISKVELWPCPSVEIGDMVSIGWFWWWCSSISRLNYENNYASALFEEQHPTLFSTFLPCGDKKQLCHGS